MYEKYIFSRECLLSLNFRALKRFNLLQALALILLMCSFQLHVLENVSPKCLCDCIFYHNTIHIEWRMLDRVAFSRYEH